MSQSIDYSILDQPDVLRVIFSPRKGWTPPPPKATDFIVPIEDDVSIACRFYRSGHSSPSILYFHGNGEIVYDYDEVAPYYNKLGINLFVTDIRGFGQSTGTPCYSNLVSDAPILLAYLRNLLEVLNYTGPLFVMGKSMGSMPALELALRHPEHITGLIIESASISLGSLMATFFPTLPQDKLKEMEELNLERVRTVRMPSMFIHGENDKVIPHELGQIFYESIGSEDKRFVTISGAGHIDVMAIGMEQYFSAISEFVLRRMPA